LGDHKQYYCTKIAADRSASAVELTIDKKEFENNVIDQSSDGKFSFEIDNYGE
jgi:hypothetical protein